MPHLSRRNILQAAGAALSCGSLLGQPGARRRRNVVFILSDDHRYDALGFMHPQTWLRTPRLDTLARDGAHLKNAFVSTALCSPSRASILTGLYAHRHQIVDNNTPIPRGTRFFPQLLQQAGYKTAFIGKWHMGNSGDEPQAGFDKWVSFRGQGTYLPERNGLNVDGKHVPQKGYITDELPTMRSTGSTRFRRSSRTSCTFRTKPCTRNSFRPSVTKALRESEIPPAEDDGRVGAERAAPSDVGPESAQQLARRRFSLPLGPRCRRILQALCGDAARRRRQRRAACSMRCASVGSSIPR